MTTGSHLLPDGTCCHCGPANLYTGPRWACNCAESPAWQARTAPTVDSSGTYEYLALEVREPGGPGTGELRADIRTGHVYGCRIGTEGDRGWSPWAEVERLRRAGTVAATHHGPGTYGHVDYTAVR